MPDKPNIQISFGISGMKRDSHQHLVDEKSYVFARNTNLETEGESIALTNEQSNYLCSRLKPGYVVIGHKYDGLNNKIWFFLTQKDATDGKRLSEIGFININSDITENEDIINQCGCDIESMLNTPLEDMEEIIPHCTYTTLIGDCEESNYCLNFDPNYPVHTIVLKQEACGFTITFASRNNPPRYIVPEKIDDYQVIGTTNCGEDERVETCIDCDKLRLFPLYEQPYIYAQAINYGGRLKRGSYEFYIAYSDKFGNELTSYISATNPIHIFDDKNIQLEQSRENDYTNHSIRLRVDNLDRRFNFYKVAVIERTDVGEVASVFVEGIHPVTDSNVTYSSNGSERMSLNKLFVEKPVYKYFGGVTTSNGILFGYDYEVEKEWNLQPVVNLLGTFVKWQTVEATENLYADGVNSSMYKTFMRDEVHPLGIKFTTNTGYKTALFPLIARPPLSPELTDVTVNPGSDVKSLLENNTVCSMTERKYRWQFYNTAKVLGSSFSDIVYPNGKIVTKEVEEECIQEDVKTYQNIVVEIDTTEDEYTDIREWLLEHGDEVCINTSPYYNPTLCDIVTDNIVTPCDGESTLPFPVCNDYNECYDKYCEPTSPHYDEETCKQIQDNCTDIGCAGICGDITYGETELYINQVENEDITFYERRYPWVTGTEPEYEHKYSTTQCLFKNYNEYMRVDIDIFDGSGNVAETGHYQTLQDIPDLYDNNSCNTASPLPAFSQITNYDVHGYIQVVEVVFWGSAVPWRSIHIFEGKDDHQSYQDNPGFVPDLNKLLTDTVAPVFPGFENRLNTKALWYEIDLSDGQEKLFEITPTRQPYDCRNVAIRSDGKVRYVIYDKCKNGNILATGVYNAEDGLFLALKKSELNNRSKVFISLDTKIVYYDHSQPHHNYERDGSLVARGHRDVFYFITAICGCFDVLIREKEYYKADVEIDRVTVNKKTLITSDCKFNAPSNDDCGVIPDKYGMFSYWESIEDYPDNEDLYDSSKITKLDISRLSQIEDDELVDLFQDTFIQSSEVIGDTTYINWKTAKDKKVTDFRCEPIRHFKFPDNAVSPFMSTEVITDFSDSKIFPLGITVDERTIEVFLDAALDNGLITDEQRRSITGYELYRGDRTVHKSVIMKGIANDMYQDEREIVSGQKTYFRNFPYNALGKNAFVTTDAERTNLVPHPYSSLKNDRFSLIAPEVYYNKPAAPTEMVVEGYMYGKALSKFVGVEDHSEWVILGENAYRHADKLAMAEIVLEAALNIATMTLQSTQNMWFQVGLTVGQNAIGTGLSIAAIAIYQGIQMSNLLTVKLPKLKTQWLEIFEQRGAVYNFASMYVSSKGHYNYFKPVKETGSKLRGLVTAKYLNNGLEALTEVENNSLSVSIINNKDRENSLYLYTGAEYPVNFPQSYVNYDNYDSSVRNSSRPLASNSGCVEGVESVRRIASPYFTLKNYVPDQYGGIDEVKWVSLNHPQKLENKSKNIFGGDTYISRVDFKNKTKLFNSNAVGLANRTPFKYSKTSNIGYTRFYVDYKSVADDATLVNDMPYLSSQYNLDCKRGGRKFYEADPAKFYLYSYGVPYFLVESEINANFRYAGKEYHEQFASRGLNVEDWVQEKNVPIAHNNLFLYNNTYSRNQTGIPYRILPAYYDKEKWDCLSEAENGVAWSEQDNSEVSLSDPWLVFRPFNIYRFPFDMGKLISLNPIESTQVMGRFENNMTLFNAIDILKERVNPDNEDLGTGGIFANRPIQFSYTELGDTGSQHRSMVSCEFGHFWVDAKRGKVFQLEPNAKGLNAISDFTKEGESGMRKWFKNNLNFKILKQGIKNFTDQHIDNHFKGLGILMWWDSKYKRVFVTKLDYVVQKPYKNKISFSGGDFYHLDGEILQKVELTDSTYFKDVSWTVAYSPIYNNWISYYDFKPQYAIAHNDFFQTGINYTKDDSEKGLWSHLLTNKSYQVFYGKYYPWTIEVPIKNTYTNNVLQDIKIWSVSRRYHNEYDYAQWRKKSFNKLIVYNDTNNSGLLHMNYDDSINKSKYPIPISDTEQGIQVTHVDNNIKVNYMYNRVKNTENHLPVWNWDENQINKQLNSDAISFNSKRVLERLRGDWFLVQLTNDNTSQFRQIFKWTLSTQEQY